MDGTLALIALLLLSNPLVWVITVVAVLAILNAVANS